MVNNLSKGAGTWRFLTSVFVAALLAATQASAKPEAIEFSDLTETWGTSY